MKDDLKHNNGGKQDVHQHSDDARILAACEKIADRASKEIAEVRGLYKFVVGALTTITVVGLWFFSKTYSDNMHDIKNDMHESALRLSDQLRNETASYVQGLRKESEAKMAAIDSLNKQVEQRIGDAQKTVEKQISGMFETTNIQAIVQKVAADQSSKLLSASIEPSIAAFNEKIDKRLNDFDSFLKVQKESAKTDLELLKIELAKLQRRNELAALADNGVGNGDVEAYRRLAKMEVDESLSATERGIARSELFRVIEAYGVFGPSRIPNIKFNVSVINPDKTKEDELAPEEVFHLLNSADTLERAKAADFLSKKAKVGSYKTALVIVSTIEKETNLEAFRYLRAAFNHVTGYSKQGTLDCRDVLNWWEENSKDIQAKDTESATSGNAK